MTEGSPDWVPCAASEEVRWYGQIAWRALTVKLIGGIGALVVGWLTYMGAFELGTFGNIFLNHLPDSLADAPVVYSFGWLSALPLGLVPLGGLYICWSLYRGFTTKYAITTQRLVVQQYPTSNTETLSLDSIEAIDCRRTVVGRLLGYGDLRFTTTSDTTRQPVFSGLNDIEQARSTLSELDDDASPLQLQREYLRVTPAHDDLQADDVLQHIGGLRNVEAEPVQQGLTRFLPIESSSPPTFEFLIVTEGADAPVEFYYSATERLSVLEQHLETAYPEAFDIERVRADLETKLVPPTEYTPEQFQTALERGDVQCTPHDPSSLRETRSSPSMNTQRADGGTRIEGVPDERTQPPLPQYDSEDSSSDGNGTHQPSAIETPQATTAEILARPSLESDDVTLKGIEWHGEGDWMTPLAQFESYPSQTGSDERAKAPLTPLVDQLAEAEQPTVFQSVFQRRSDWSQKAYNRKHDIRHGRDGLAETVLDALSKMLWGYEDYEDQTVPHDEQHVAAIDEKEPRHTFVANLRLLTVAETPQDEASTDRRLETLSTVFDHLDGHYYGLDGQRLTSNGFRQSTKQDHVRQTLRRLLNRDVVTERRWKLPWQTSPELVCNPSEIANFITVPDAESLSTEGARTTGAEETSRNPLPRPSDETLEEFASGVALGRAIGETGEPTELVSLPPRLLTKHVGRWGSSGAGKSTAMINDALSAHASVPGPVVLFDRKGDGMCQEYLRSHFSRFGAFDDVYSFDIPERLPALSVIDIRPALATGRDRELAVQDTVEHFHEVLRLVMGREQYERAYVAIDIIGYLIQALLDEEYGADAIGLDALFEAALDMQHNQELPTISDGRRDIEASLRRHFAKNDHQFHQTMDAVANRLDKLKNDPYLYRLFNYVPEWDDATETYAEPCFDFRAFLDQNAVLLFDLGALRPRAQNALIMVFLSTLWDAIQTRRQEATAEYETITNLIIDEAAPIAATDLMAEQLLPESRSFGLSVELAMQYPRQVAHTNPTAYEELLTNVHTKIFGKISADDRVIQSLAHDALEPEAIRNRLNRLPPGETLADLPSPTFGETGPAPFSLAPLPLPEGHPESENPLTDEQVSKFEALHTAMCERTAEQFTPSRSEDTIGQSASSIHGRDATAPSEPGTTNDLGTLMASSIRAVQLREDLRDTNDWVPASTVDSDLRSRLTTTEHDQPTQETLGELRAQSEFIDVSLDADHETVIVRLTDAGERAAVPDTGSVRASGGEAHDDALNAIERALIGLNFTVDILEQDGSEQPDGVATHPTLDAPLAIEAETTTPDRPVKVLTNLKRAHEARHIPLFVVETDDTETYWANRVTGILHPPVKEVQGERRLYTYDDPITYGGGAAAANGVTAVRPTAGAEDSRQTIWCVDEDGYVLSDSSGTEHAQVSAIDDAPRAVFPALYTYDSETETFVVYDRGETQTYPTKDAFEAEWVTVKRPFVPESALSSSAVEQTTYAIAIVHTDGEVVIYSAGDIHPVSALIDGTIDLHSPSKSSADPSEAGEREQSASSGSVTQRDDQRDASSVGRSAAPSSEMDTQTHLEHFITTRLRLDSDSVVPKDDCYRAYATNARAHDVEPLSKSWFGRRLGEHLDIETRRVRREGELIRCYTGIRLTDGDESLEGEIS
ncbi:PH domain-containing protein [Halomarina litorea]|uniref:PH domain-containing protein n=1 Tax=Halomarina litorea TaxID=2961595 RepID=UPI0020C3616F|nr:PH domain-containing protein [Halomarina sp. BCD28]